MDFDLEGIPQRLKRLRESNEMTQAQLAERCGLPQPSVAFWETGARQMTLQNAARVCTAMGIGLDELCGWIGEYGHHTVCASER